MTERVTYLLDMNVAATTLAKDSTLVSRDSDFAGIDGVSVLATFY